MTGIINYIISFLLNIREKRRGKLIKENKKETKRKEKKGKMIKKKKARILLINKIQVATRSVLKEVT